jgi:hypothetical protein
MQLCYLFFVLGPWSFRVSGVGSVVCGGVNPFERRLLSSQQLEQVKGRCSRAFAPLGNTGRADTFNYVAETGPRLTDVTGEARLGLNNFLPEV